MHIENMTIYLGAMPSAAEFNSALALAGVAEAAAAPAAAIPRIGQPWPGQGGIYAGLALSDDQQRNQHVILSTTAPEKGMPFDAAITLAKTIGTDGHQDFEVPNRAISWLLCANLRELFDKTKWYWTGTQYSEGYAFIQYFSDGYQGSNDKKFEGLVRFVRRFDA